MTECAKKVLPVFNRCVVFSTADDAYHGHPDPLTCPPDRARRSMALYYYTVEKPEGQRPTTPRCSRQRPGEEFNSTPRQTLKRWVPPVIVGRRTRAAPPRLTAGRRAGAVPRGSAPRRACRPALTTGATPACDGRSAVGRGPARRTAPRIASRPARPASAQEEPDTLTGRGPGPRPLVLPGRWHSSPERGRQLERGGGVGDLVVVEDDPVVIGVVDDGDAAGGQHLVRDQRDVGRRDHEPRDASVVESVQLGRRQ